MFQNNLDGCILSIPIFFKMALNTDGDLFYLRTNPLGMKGNIAKRYGEVVQDLWGTCYRSIAPLKLRVSASNVFSIRRVLLGGGSKVGLPLMGDRWHCCLSLCITTFKLNF